MFGTLLASLLALVVHLGPLAMLGGPVGMGLAWAGSFAGNKTVKLIAIAVGLLILIGVSVGITIRIEHLEQTEAAYKKLFVATSSLEAKYGCASRPVHERDLAACLTARERDIEAARAAKLAEFQRTAAQAQADLDVANAQIAAQSGSLDSFIDQAVPADDGPVPKILLDTWARERAARGHP